MDVILSKNALKEFESLPKKEQMKVKKKLLALKSESHSGKRLSGSLSGIYSVRAWPYRILYETNQKEKRIEVLKIAHRQGVYKK